MCTYLRRVGTSGGPSGVTLPVSEFRRRGRHVSSILTCHRSRVLFATIGAAGRVDAQSITPGRVGPPVRQTASLDSTNGSSTSGKATVVTAGDGSRMDVQVDIIGPVDMVEIVGPDGTATDTLTVSAPGRQTMMLQPPSSVTVMNTIRGQVTIRVKSAVNTVAEGDAEPGLHRTTRYRLDDGGEPRGECYLLTEGGASTSSLRSAHVRFEDFAFLQCEVHSPGWTVGGFYNGPPGAGGVILFDASSLAGQTVFMGVVNDPPPGIFTDAEPEKGHFFFNGSPFAFGDPTHVRLIRTTFAWSLSSVIHSVDGFCRVATQSCISRSRGRPLAGRRSRLFFGPFRTVSRSRMRRSSGSLAPFPSSRRGLSTGLTCATPGEKSSSTERCLGLRRAPPSIGVAGAMTTIWIRRFMGVRRTCRSPFPAHRVERKMPSRCVAPWSNPSRCGPVREVRVGQPLQNPRAHRVMRFHVDQPPGRVPGAERPCGVRGGAPSREAVLRLVGQGAHGAPRGRGVGLSGSPRSGRVGLGAKPRLI